MATFKQAIKWRKEGKVVVWNKIYKLEGNNTIQLYDLEESVFVPLLYGQIEGNQWSIYEELKKTLSDKMIVNPKEHNTPRANISYELYLDIKVFIKDLKSWLEEVGYDATGDSINIRNKIDELVGDKLK